MIIVEDLAGYWTQKDGEKGDLLDRCEQYARWTVPSIFPVEENNENSPQETEKGNVAIGARLVHHLAHRIVDTMFPNDKPFFAVRMTPEAEKKYIAENGEEQKLVLENSFASIENAAMRRMNLTEYRPVAVNAVSLKIVTGNALIHRLPDGKRSVYSVRDYCVTRGISGDLQDVLLRDSKKYGSLSEELKAQVEQAQPKRKFRDADPVTLYTYYWYEGKRWHRRQAIEDIEIDQSKTSFKEEDFPCLVLAWNLGRGDHYGRGLVEDYSVSFHNIDVTSAALIDLFGIAADVKFLVNDSSSFDVEAWNRAKRGEYVPGKEGDITVPDYKFAVEVNVLMEYVAKLERELAQAFLLSSAGIRDAERVTAEEIRFFAREIESAFGGLYSRLALDWQKKEAEYQLAQIDFSQYIESGDKVFDTIVTTGLESLSREGKLDALRLAIGDLQMLDVVPEDIRKAFNPIKFTNFIFTNRGVDPTMLLYTEEEFRANQQAEVAQQEALMEKQGEVAVASKAAAAG